MSEQRNNFGKEVGLAGGFVLLRCTWDLQTQTYPTSRTEQSWDGVNWEPWDQEHNTASVRYIGGPEDGKVEW